jgi:hypothetical protein
VRSDLEFSAAGGRQLMADGDWRPVAGSPLPLLAARCSLLTLG